MNVKEVMRMIKRPTSDHELRRLYAILRELDPLSDDYYKIGQRIDQLKKADSYEKDRHISANNVLGNLTSILGIGFTLYSEEAWNKIARSKAWTWIPKSQTK